MIKVVSDIDTIRHYCDCYRSNGNVIALVPTMGALHEGHLSLIDRAADLADIVIVSVYVNPTQFAPTEDFDHYPRDLASDVEKMKSRGANIVFAPDDQLMYPSGYATYVTVKGLTEGLCGRSRPAHFRGVTTIVTKLFNIIMPNYAIFGQKDAQQVAVIRQMTKDLNFNINIISAPIIRESDGLAMSSRNAYLSKEERVQAPILFQSLCEAKSRTAGGVTDAEILKNGILEMIESASLADVEYVEIVHPLTLKPVKTVTDGALIALAVRFGNTRLIDNIEIKKKI